MTEAALPKLNSIRLGGRLVVWQEAGQGIPLVLVHGIGGHSGAWKNQFSSFSDNYRVIAWNAPGYGGSDALSEDDLSERQYAASLVEFLQALGVERPHMVGHSLGAIIILAATATGAPRSRSLTLLQPVTGGGKMSPVEREKVRLARIADMRRLGPLQFAVERGSQILSASTPKAVADEAVNIMKGVSEAGYLAAWEMMCRADITALLLQACPIQVISGSDDPVSPPRTCKAIAEQIPGAEYYCLQDVGHYASVEAPALLDLHLRRFISSK